MPASQPQNLHRLFADCASAGDLESLMSLYEDGAIYISPDGTHAEGATAIRQHLRGLIALSPQITPISSHAVLAGDVALILNRWRVTFGSYDDQAAFEGSSIEVARRQNDRSWRYVIDNPSADALPI
jgi:ketosteroid isomerase-like protein